MRWDKHTKTNTICNNLIHDYFPCSETPVVEPHDMKKRQDERKKAKMEWKDPTGDENNEPNQSRACDQSLLLQNKGLDFVHPQTEAWTPSELLDPQTPPLLLPHASPGLPSFPAGFDAAELERSLCAFSPWWKL